MPRSRCHVFVNDGAPRYVAVWSTEWTLLECRALASGGNFGAALDEAIERARLDGWIAEGAADFGFVFLCRGTQRRLVMLTPRDPRDLSLQSFNPFRVSE